MNEPLDILNHCMVIVGENPVSSYDSRHPTAISARQVIERLDKQLQKRGWWYNKERNVLLSPNPMGEVILPSDTLDVKALRPNGFLVRRNGRLYDPYNHTYVIDKDVHVDITLQLPVEDLPNEAFDFLMAKSAFEFFCSLDGDGKSIQYLNLQTERDRAEYDLKRVDLREKKNNSQLRPVSLLLKMRLQAGYTFNPVYPGGRPV